uniref:Transcription factor GTE4-like n=1 Tax=Populus alba TaxID=43335 RepID=A0A4U5M4F8_POPAL|nr:transcription factor GTE4-like [Populus alba]
MASGSVVEAGNEGGEVREKQRYTESKVYTRKAFKGPKRNSLTSTSTSTSTSTNNNTATTTAGNNNSNTNLTTTSTAAADNNNVNTTTTTAPSATETATVPTTTSTAATETAAAPATLSTTATKTATTAATTTATANETRDRDNNEELVEVRESEPVVVDNTNTAQQVQQPVSLSIVVSDDSLNLNRLEVQEVVPSVREKVVERGHAVGNGVFLKEGLDNKVKVDLLSRSKQEKRELKKKLESELALVRDLVKRIEAKEMQLGVGRLSNSRVVLVNDRVDNRLTRVNSEVGSVGVPRESTAILTPTPRQSRPLNQLSISVLENSLGVGEFVEKEKRTPKANQFYMNSEFLLAKDKFPPAESNKKSKLIGKKQGAGESGYGFGTSTKIFKNCSTLLDKLMKNKHGWVFNTPVDAKGLGLHDLLYHYQASNGLGHGEVQADQELLLDIFETKWAVIKSDYDLEMRFAASYEIIKKRSSALSQHDDEIEVDIDSVDVETLWSWIARTEAQQNVQQKIPASVVVEAPKETKADERNASTLSPVQVEKQGDNGSRSSSSSSSSSDSGSSSSDSDSDNSSASGSDVGN